MVTFTNENEKLVYKYIEKFMMENQFSPKQKDMAEKTGISVTHCGRIVNKLIDIGLLKRTASKQGLELMSAQSEAHQ